MFSINIDKSDSAILSKSMRRRTYETKIEGQTYTRSK